MCLTYLQSKPLFNFNICHLQAYLVKGGEFTKKEEGYWFGDNSRKIIGFSIKEFSAIERMASSALSLAINL